MIRHRHKLVLALIGLSPMFAWSQQVDIAVIPQAEAKATINALKQSSDLDWWLGFAEATVIAAPMSQLDRLTQGLPVSGRFSGVDQRYLAFHGRGCDHDPVAFPERVLYDGGRWSLVQLPAPLTEANADRSLRPFKGNVQVTFNLAGTKGAGADPRIQALVDQVDADRWFADVETLASYDRHSNHPELADARDWLIAQFSAMPGITSVETQPFLVSGQMAWNVIATLPGHSQADDWLIVGGHYDSRRANSQTTSPTPGAEDNATGCSGVLELARIATQASAEKTILFMCYSGEEQGLIGSSFNAAQLDVAGDLDKVELMMNMDMIGFSEDSDLDVLLETESLFQDLITEYADAASIYTNLRTVGDIFACCSDHMPYINRGVPALLSIENDYFNYDHYHEQTDLPANITRAHEMGGGILRMNMAVLAQRAGVGTVLPDLIFSDGVEAP